jgi:hypothetical protein
MKTYDNVEEYLEVLAGHRTIDGKVNSQWFYSFQPIISLARYDVSVLSSMTDQTTQAQALTERQGDLLCKILLKYARQLAAKGIDVSPVEHPTWRVALRKMDYSQRLMLDNDKIIVKFPYQQTLIDSIKDFAKSSQGAARWDKDSKTWNVALTEYNLSWLYTWAQTNQFQIDTALVNLMDKIVATEQTPYAVELYMDGDQLNISNAAPSLMEYIATHIGALELDNLTRLVDMSAVLGYTVNADLAQAVIAEFGFRFYNIASSREVKINPGTLMSSDDFASIIHYAEVSKRLPVVIYEPDMSGRMLDKLMAVCSAEDVEIAPQNSKEWTPEGNRKFIYAHRPIKTLDKIPLIISSAGMVFGGDKQRMIHAAEKVVYCASDVYNKKSVKVKNIASEINY